MDLVQPHRLIFRPVDPTLQAKDPNGDERHRWNQVKDVSVTSVEDTHG